MPEIASRYRLDRVVGRGGMGEVWLAEDTLLARRVAAKRIGARDPSEDDLHRARREAKVAAMLDDDHVVRVFDMVPDAGELWLVMEYVESVNLAQLVRGNGALDPTNAARMIHQAALALAAAHRSGIVHRDVKPSNLLVESSGHVKLGDFGIARLEGDASVTRTGQLVGSPGYLAPEVASGRTATAASDLWSLGATTWFAVEGRAPYDASDGNVVGALFRIVNDEPPTAGNAGWLAPLLEHLLVKDPARRWSADQVTAYLGAALAQDRAGAGAGPVPAAALASFTALGDAAGTGDPGDGSPTSTLDVPAPASPARPAGSSSVTAPTTAVATGAAAGAHQVPPPLTRSVTAPGTQRVLPPGPPPTSGPARRPRTPGSDPRRRRWAVVAAVVVVALLAGLVVTLAVRGRQSPPSAQDEPSSSTSASPTPTEPTSAGMQAFVRSYLRQAPSDPQESFRRLTRGFQDQSGGLSGYEGFWGTVASATPTRIEADPGARTVTYDVDYTMDDGRRTTDTVTLELELSDGKYLVAGER